MFPIPADTGGEDEADLSVLHEAVNQESLAGRTAAGRTAMGGTAAGRTAVGVPGRAPAAPPRADNEGALPSSDDENLFDGAALGRGSRSSEVMRYPMAPAVDKYLPIGLVALALLMMVGPSLASDDLGHVWVPWLRLVMTMGLYTLIAFPLALVGVRRSAHKGNFDLPLGSKFRVWATFLFPTALAFLMWLTAQSLAGLVTGLLLGTICGLGALYLTIRLRPAEAPVAFAMSSACYVGGAALAIVCVLGVNLILANALPAEATQTFVTEDRLSTQSPLGPGLAWAEMERARPVVAKSPQPSPPPDPVAPVTTTNPATDAPPQPDTVASTTRPGVPPTDGAAPAPPAPAPPEVTLAPPEVAALPPAPPEDAVATPPAPSPGGDDTASAIPLRRTPRPAPGGPTAPPANATVPPADVTAAAPVETELGTLREVTEVGHFERLLTPAVAGPALAVVREDAGDDVIDVFKGTPPVKAGQARFRPAGAQPADYVLSPDGDYLVWTVTWPKLGAQVWSVADSRAQILEFNAANGRPTILGFVSAETFVVRWDHGTDAGLELWSVKTAARVGRGIVFSNIIHESSPGNRAISHSGRLYAFAGRYQRGTHLFVYDLMTSKLVRRIEIKALSPQWAVRPTGIAFSPDDTKVAALFEQQGNGLLASWRVADGKPTGEQVFPAGVLPTPPAPQGHLSNATSRALAWLGEGTAWLVYGQRAYDEDTGRLLGETGVPAAVDQRVLDGTTVQLETARPDGSRALMVLDVNKDKITPKPNNSAAGG